MTLVVINFAHKSGAIESSHHKSGEMQSLVLLMTTSHLILWVHKRLDSAHVQIYIMLCYCLEESRLLSQGEYGAV